MITGDPGLLHPAVAVFHHSFLVRAERVPVPEEFKTLPVGERVRRIVDLLGARLLQILGTEQATLAVLERPKVYAGARSKGDPNDLIPLAMMIGGLATGLRCPVASPLPGEWAGATKKSTTGDPWKSSRGDLVREVLGPDEVLRCEKSHDAIDACLMGLVALRRVRRYYPGAS